MKYLRKSTACFCKYLTSNPTYFILKTKNTFYKSAIGVVFQFGVMFGSFLVSAITLDGLLGSWNLWPVGIATCAVLPLVNTFISYFFTEETPAFLVKEKEFDEAEKVMKILFGKTSGLHDLEIIHEDEHESSWQLAKDIFTTKSLRNSLFVGCFLFFEINIAGINTVFYYSTQTFIDAGIPTSSAEYCSVAVNAVNALAVGAASFVIEKTGHRKLMLVGTFGIMLCNILNVIFMGYNTGIFSYLLVASTFLMIIFYEIGPSPIPWETMAQFLPYEYRSVGQSMAGLVNWTVNVFGTALFPIGQRILGQYIFIIFAFSQAVSILVIYIFLPETQGRTPQEMQRIFDLPFQKWRKA